MMEINEETKRSHAIGIHFHILMKILQNILLGWVDWGFVVVVVVFGRFWLVAGLVAGLVACLVFSL